MLDLFPPELQPPDETMHSCDIKSQVSYSEVQAIQKCSNCSQVKEYLQNWTSVWVLSHVIDPQR